MEASELLCNSSHWGPSPTELGINSVTMMSLGAAILTGESLQPAIKISRLTRQDWVIRLVFILWLLLILSLTRFF